MDVLTFRDYCLSLPMAEESTPFDETTLVYKVGGKMFACADMAEFEWVAVKCDPAEAVLLREQYDEVSAAWHFNKRHWNAVRTTGDLPDGFIREQIRNSYLLVLRCSVTPKALRAGIGTRRRLPGADLAVCGREPLLCLKPLMRERGRSGAIYGGGLGLDCLCGGFPLRTSLFAGNGLRNFGALSFSAEQNRIRKRSNVGRTLRYCVIRNGR